MDTLKVAARKLIEIVSSNWNGEEKQNTLKRKLDHLTAIQEDINTQLETVESSSSSSNKKQKRQVANWLTNVESVKQRYQNLEEDEKRSYWSKFWGAQEKRLIDEVDELIGESRFQGALVLEVCETKAEPLLVTKLVGKAFEDNLRKVLEWVMEDEVLRIGIYGMGGVGKTTLATHIYNLLLEGQNRFRFSNIYWITISQDFSIRKLQDRIAEVIKFNLGKEEEEKIRAVKLSKALDKKQKYVIILDDLWNLFFLEEIGIPMGCKLIMTTRSLDVCREMSCHKKIKLEPLLEEESWKLFVEKLENYATLSFEVKERAKFVAKECDGLPLGIISLAASMRGVNDVREWRSVLQQLKQSTSGLGEIDDKVFKVLNLSYERLRDTTLQECLLYCALFPEDFKIKRKELIEYLISEDIIKNLNSRQAQLDRGHTMLNKLENACLLEDSSDDLGNHGVKMHDLIRDMAVNKMKGNLKVMVKTGEGLKEVPNTIEWSKDLVRVSMIRNYIKEIPRGHSPSCPNLSTLLLCGNLNLKFIADSFFSRFCGLKVLDLSLTAIEVLPNSVSNLVSLTSLLLSFCKQLRYIPSLATLKTLKKLDLQGCASVKVVPGGLELLSNLQYLDMDGTQIKDIPNGLLSKFSHLQCLSLGWSTSVEVKSTWLEKVEHLVCRFSKPQHFNIVMKDYHGRPLPSICRLQIGESGNLSYSMKDKLVFYNGCDIGEDGELLRIPKDLDLLVISRCRTLRSLNKAFLPDGTGEVRFGTCEGAPPPLFRSGGVFSCLKCFFIWCCHSITRLIPYELLPYLQNLEEIIVKGCKKIEQIIDEESNSDNHAEFISLPKLKCLKLYDLPELQSICSKKMTCDSVRTITITNCRKLKRMPLSLLQLDNGQLSPLPSLEKILIDPPEWWDSVELDHPNAKDVLKPPLLAFEEEYDSAEASGEEEHDSGEDEWWWCV